MEKLLAALNLPQVGEIRLVDPDDESYEDENDGSLFTIELNDRVYTMKVCNDHSPIPGGPALMGFHVSCFRVTGL